MRELVADDALQLLAGEALQRAARDGDRGVVRRPTRREGVDAGLLVEDVDRGDRDARGDGHLLDDVQEPPLEAVVRVRADAPPAERLRHLPAAAAQLRRAVERRDRDDRDDPRDDPRDDAEASVEELARGGLRAVARDEPHHRERERADQQRDRRDAQQMQRDEEPRALARLFLVVQKGGHSPTSVTFPRLVSRVSCLRSTCDLRPGTCDLGPAG